MRCCSYLANISKLLQHRMTARRLVALLTAAVLAILWLLAPRGPTSVDLSEATFAAYSDVAMFEATWTAAFAAQKSVKSIVHQLVAPRKSEPIDRNPPDMAGRYSLSRVSFYSIRGHRLSLGSIVAAVKSTASSEEPIPSVLHYFIRENVTYSQSMCMRRAVQQMRPSMVIIWLPLGLRCCDGVPWQNLLAALESDGWVSQVALAVPWQFRWWLLPYQNSLAHVHLKMVQHLMPFGGIALDPNVYVLRNPMDKLRKHRLPVFGHNDTRALSIDMIATPPLPAVMYLWRLAIRFERYLTGRQYWIGYEPLVLLQQMLKANPDLAIIQPGMYQEFSYDWPSKAYFLRVP